MSIRQSLLSTCLTLALSALAAPASAATFDFEDVALGTFAPFSETDDGITATFSGAGFFVTPGFFATLTNHTLLSADPSPNTLEIAFSAPVSSLDLRFALNSAPPGSLVLSAFSGVTAVGGASAPGAIPPGFSFPEGVLSFSGVTFDRVVLTSAALDFAIDEVTVGDSSVPEPMTVTLLGSALLAGACARRRRMA